VKTLEDSIHLVSPDGPRHQLIPTVGLQFPQHLPSGHRVVAAVQEDSLCAPKIIGYWYVTNVLFQVVISVLYIKKI
jgi:hypothetical protein